MMKKVLVAATVVAATLTLLAPPSLAHVDSRLRAHADWAYGGDLADGTGRIGASVRLDVANVSSKRVDALCTVRIDDSYYGVRYLHHKFSSIRRYYPQRHYWGITTMRDLNVKVAHCHILVA